MENFANSWKNGNISIEQKGYFWFQRDISAYLIICQMKHSYTQQICSEIAAYYSVEFLHKYLQSIFTIIVV